MSAIIPRPFRDLIFSPGVIKSLDKYDTEFAKEQAGKMIKSAFRIAITASAVYFVKKTSSSIPAAAMLGACLSLPCTLIASSCWLLPYGTTAALSALATGSFKSAAIAIASFAAGYCALEWHDNLLPNEMRTLFEFGALEWLLISPTAKNWQETVCSWFKK